MAAWLTLIVAGVFEVAWAVGLKYTVGFSRLVPSVLTFLAIAVSMYLLSIAARSIPIGTAYAVWVGIGATGTALLGILVLGEPIGWARGFFLVLLIVSIVGLKLTSPSPAS